MSSYPALLSLGINRPEEISGYTLSTRHEIDTLHVKYSRQKGSLLPTGKKFTFPRRPVHGVQPMPGQALITEISPALEAAIEELSTLLSKETSRQERKAELLKELDDFEDYIRTQIAEFKSEIEKLTDE